MELIDRCQTCGHDPHEPGKCEDRGLVPDCICLCCWGICTCDGSSWEHSDYWVEGKPSGGRFTTPELTFEEKYGKLDKS